MKNTKILIAFSFISTLLIVCLISVLFLNNQRTSPSIQSQDMPAVATTINIPLVAVATIAAFATPTATPAKSSVQTTANSSKCVVTVNGKQYDITTLRQTHSGGDVFTCGTDMTNIFQGQHGTNYNLIARYLI